MSFWSSDTAIRLEPGELLKLNLQGAARLELRQPGKPKKNKGPKQPKQPQSDGANILALLLRGDSRLPDPITFKAWQEQPAAYADNTPVREFHFVPDRNFRADVAFPAPRLLVEVDGGTYMVREGQDGKKTVGGRHNTKGDREKTNLAAIHGWRRLVFTTEDVKRKGVACVDTILRALEWSQE